jgi:phosphoheptose isomerase
MTFPERTYVDVGSFADDYLARVAQAGSSLDRPALARAVVLLREAYRAGATVFACGNGGSAALSNHLACDHLKGTQTDTTLRPRVVSLSSNIELMSAIANDIAFEEVFVYPLRTLARKGDVLVAVSASGDSENVVRALGWARENGLQAIALTGFSGGRAAGLADVHVHARGDNYGVVEDVHQSVMHIFAQFLRQEHLSGPVAARVF